MQFREKWLLDDALFVDRFGGSDIKYGSGAFTICTITPNLPDDAIIKWAALHFGFCLENENGEGNITFNGNVVASMYRFTGSIASGGLMTGLPITPAWVNKNTANTVALTGAKAGCYSVWLEIGYTLSGGVNSILRRARRGRWYGSGAQGYTSLTASPTGDLWSWSPTIDIPSGFSIRNAMLMMTMNNTAYFVNWSTHHVYLDGGRIQATNPGGAAQNVGAGYGANRCLHNWTNRDAYDAAPGATFVQAYDLKNIINTKGEANFKLNGIKITESPINDSNYLLSGQWGLWVSYAPVSAGS